MNNRAILMEIWMFTFRWAGAVLDADKEFKTVQLMRKNGGQFARNLRWISQLLVSIQPH